MIIISTQPLSVVTRAQLQIASPGGYLQKRAGFAEERHCARELIALPKTTLRTMSPVSARYLLVYLLVQLVYSVRAKTLPGMYPIEHIEVVCNVCFCKLPPVTLAAIKMSSRSSIEVMNGFYPWLFVTCYRFFTLSKLMTLKLLKNGAIGRRCGSTTAWLQKLTKKKPETFKLPRF